MEVLKTTSPTASPSKPCPLPRKTRPSSSSNVAVFFIRVSLCLCVSLILSIQRSHFVHWPISKHGSAVNVFRRHKPPHTAVVGLISVVAQNIVMAGLDVDWRVRAMVQKLRQDVIFIEFLVIHQDFAAFDFNYISRHADDAL